ncbi:MAG: activator of prop osmoprotectant transporter [Alphaproteobacteria bacterium]|nr:activator of prop osmoprotectant transporter [Alphaproteobacteria bacterium]
MRKQELHPRTAIINQKQKHQSKAARLDALKWLAKRFPKAFDNTVQISPLKKGVVTDVLEYVEDAAKDGISKSKLREAIVVFTRRIDYLTVLKAREDRIDLNGVPVEKVTKEEAEKAALKIKRRVEQSAKNAKKIAGNAQLSQPSSISYPTTSDLGYTRPTYYSNGSMHLGEEQGGSKPKVAKSTATVIKRKSVKQYDPEAVARLKEKLGLSKKEDANKS